MKRTEIFELIGKAVDPVKDGGMILANLHYTHHFMVEKYNALLAPHNLTAIQSNVLSIVAFFGATGAALEDIKEMVLEPGSDVSRTVSRLKEKGFVQKFVNPKNRRKVIIRLTPEGTELQKKLVSLKQINQITSGLTKTEVTALTVVLAKLRKTQP